MAVLGGPETPGRMWGVVKASTAKESLKALKEVPVDFSLDRF